jgi:N-acyl amino acid synthase of PEP-CTERM/exosortase system
MSSPDIIEHFLRYFCLVPADTPALKEEVYRLRYDVYCREFGYEPAENFPDKMEQDEYDKQALHVLVRHRSTGLAAGCTRLIQTAPVNPNRPLPFEKACKGKLDLAYINSLALPRHTICEASRFSVHSNFRRRHGESGSRFGDMTSLNSSFQERRTYPLISVSTALATTALTELTDRPNMFAMMEPFFPRLLHRIGYDFIKVGANISYHGNRAAYFVETDSVLLNLSPALYELYKSIRNSLEVLSRTAA